MANGLLAKNGIIVTGSIEVQNAVTASAFSGDGSALTGISTDPFPYTGSAEISGSLEVIGPITAVNKPGGTTIDITNITTANHGAEGVYIGYNAAPNNTLARNIVIGKDAGANSTTMYDTVVIGANAGESVSSGMRSSVTIGTFAGMSTNGLGSSVTIGAYAGRYTNGGFNVFLGHSAGYWYEGGSSILIGRNAGYSANGQTDGDRNMYIGYTAGSQAQGDDNITLGYQAGYTLSGSKNVVLGYQAGYNLTGSNQLIIANTGSHALVTGDFANNTFNISGSVSASTYYGDGSNLTGISSDPFPYTGSAEISGSLTVRDADTTLRGNLNVKGENTDTSIINLGGNVNSGGSTKIIFKHHSHPTNEAAGILSSGTSYGRSTGLIFYVRSAFSDAGTLLSTDKILTLGAGGATFHKNAEFNNLELSYSDSSGGRLGMPLDMPSPTRSTLTLEGGQATYQNRGGGSVIIKAGGGSGTGNSGIISFYTVTGSLASGEENTVLERARFTPNGDFGIGTTTPTEKLEVSGSIKSSGLSVNGTQRSLYTTQSFQYDGSNLTQITMSFENGTEEITNITYDGSNIDTIVITGSDGINKTYTLSYDGSGNVTNIIVS